jgi:hypothetical protein
MISSSERKSSRSAPVNLGSATALVDSTALDIEYPVLGLFRDPAGKAIPGILPFDIEGEFQGAVAMAAMSDFVDKTDVAVWQFRDVRADLCEVNLSPGTRISAVVLTASAEVWR